MPGPAPQARRPFIDDGTLFGSLTDAGKHKVLDKVAEMAAEKFKAYMDAVEQFMVFRLPKGEALWMLYQTRPPEVWATLFQSNRPEFDRQVGEYQMLASRYSARQALGEMARGGNANPMSETTPVPMGPTEAI